MSKIESKINSKLWADEILKQIIARLGFGAVCYSEQPQEVECESMVTKHKYFAFRVPNIEEAEGDKDQLAEFSSYGAKGMAMAIKSDIAAFIEHRFFNDETRKQEAILDALNALGGKRIVFFSTDDIRVQSAWDVDNWAHSIVGDWEYTIGII